MSLSITSAYFNPVGWGPSQNLDDDLLPEFLRDLPFPIVYKADRSNRMADLTQVTMRSGDADDESEFHLVEGRTRKPVLKGHGNRAFNRSNFYFGNQRIRYQPRGYFPSRGPYNRNRGNRRRYVDARKSEVSMTISPEWGDPAVVFDFSQLNKLRPSDENDIFPVQALSSTEYEGQIPIFNWDKKKINLRNAVPLKRTEKQFLNFSSLQDSILRSFAASGRANVIMSEAVMSALMAIVRSIYSWDLEVNKQDGIIWFDKRPNSRFDWVNVNENAADYSDIGDDGMNSSISLSNEALYVQRCYSQQVVDNVVKKYDVAKPFVCESNVASFGYTYRILPLNPTINVGVRCEIDTLKSTESGYSRIMVRTLNEYDVRITGDWRKTLETQRGGVLATELKNNMFKVQRWIIQAKLAGCDSIVIGFVSRQSFKDNFNHVILAVEEYSIDELIEQMNINLDQMWTIFRYIIEHIMAQPDGKYALFKEPMGATLKLYRISQDNPTATATSSESKNNSFIPSSFIQMKK